MKNIIIGKGLYKTLYEGKGVYAARNFDIGEVVVPYNLRLLTPFDFAQLPKEKQDYVHSFWGNMYLFSEPACYVNHSRCPNTRQDLQSMCDIAIKPIKKGEMITTNATTEIQNELETFVEAYENKKAGGFTWLSGGYRNAVISYKLPTGLERTLNLKRIDGNWHILKECI